MCAFLLFKALMGRCRSKFKIQFESEKRHLASSDILTRHRLDSLLVQIAIVNILLGVTLEYFITTAYEEALMISGGAGLLQLIFLLLSFSMPLHPSHIKHSKENLWKVQSRALVLFTFMLLGYFLIPLLNLYQSLEDWNKSDNGFLYLLASFIWSCGAFIEIARKVAANLASQIGKPCWPTSGEIKKQQMPSLVMGDCPTRKLYLRQDIYCFCWTVCLSPKEQL